MEFEWDDDKATSNLRKHRIDFDVAIDVFLDPRVVIEEDRFAMGELRYQAIGFADNQLVSVLFSEPAEQITRLISARKASPSQRRLYDASFF